MIEITSVHNPRVKAAVRLRDRRYREKQGQILIDGARELLRAVEGGVKVLEVFTCQQFCDSLEGRRALAVALEHGAQIIHVSEPVFEKLAFGQRTEGVLAVAEMPLRKLADMQLPDNPLLAVLEGVEKPGNLGAVVRSADAAGIAAVIAADAICDLYNPNAIRASLGAIFTVPICADTTAAVLDWLRQRGIKIVAARVDSSRLYTEIDYRQPTAVVLGSEARGLSRLWDCPDVTTVRLPMLGKVDSLNVSAAAAVLFYEARRQRGILHP